MNSMFLSCLGWSARLSGLQGRRHPEVFRGRGSKPEIVRRVPGDRQDQRDRHLRRGGLR